MQKTTDTGKIIRNTAMLYFRMLFSSAAGLYTSRLVLEALGVVDFGIYNVVGGIIIITGFLNHAMAASTQRYLSVEMGKGDPERLRQVLSTGILIHILLAGIVTGLAISVGYWLLNNFLKIPPDRSEAAGLVYFFSVAAFVFSVLAVPFYAFIISREKMQVLAFTGMLEALLKIAAVTWLTGASGDRLIMYAAIMAIISVLISLIYVGYCLLKFPEVRSLKAPGGIALLREMIGFAAWNLLGVLAGIGYNQGVNILLNLFFGPVVNAARGIAFQVQGAVLSFVSNFQLAANPSITREYASGNRAEACRLVLTASVFSFYLLLLPVVPLITEAPRILSIWLGKVPDYTVSFMKLVLVDLLIGSFSGPLHILAQATGHISRYQLAVSGILLLNLPVSFLLLRAGYNPEVTMLVAIGCSALALMIRLLIIRQMTGLPLRSFTTGVFIKALIVSSILVVLLWMMEEVLSGGSLPLSLLTSVVMVITVVILFGLNQQQRKMLADKGTGIFFRKKGDF